MSSGNWFAASGRRASSLCGCLWLLTAAALLLMAPGARAAAVSLTVVCTDSATSGPLANAPISFYEVTSNGLLASVPGSPKTSDATGSVTMSLDTVKTYYVKARATNGVWTRTVNFQPAAGAMNLLIGAAATVTPTSGTQASAPPSGGGATTGGGGSGGSSDIAVSYTITVKDGQSLAPLSGQSVYVYEVASTGDIRLPSMPMTTNGAGVITVSVDTTKTYYAQVRTYNTRWSKSAKFVPTAGGNLNFYVGTVAIRVVDATNAASPTPLADFRVTLQDHPSADAWRSLEVLRTDADGWLRIDPAGIEAGAEFRLKGEYGPGPTIVCSDPVSLPGAYTFPVAGSIVSQLTARQKAFHVINRLTFGMTPELYDTLMGFTTDTQLDAWRTNFVAQQLDPASSPDPNIETHIKAYTADPNDPALTGTTASPWVRDDNSRTDVAWAVGPARLAGNNSTASYVRGTTPNAGRIYRCYIAHTSTDTSTQPPVGADWQKFWYDIAWTQTTTRWNGVAFTDTQMAFVRNDVIQYAAPGDATTNRVFKCNANHLAVPTNVPTSSTGGNSWSGVTAGAGLSIGLVRPSLAQLQLMVLRRMTLSQNQLQEKMAWFWENHFSTSIEATNKVQCEMYDNQLYRAKALGKFKDLVTLTAKSAQMCYYLNSRENTKNSPNENFGRELMELHTMSVDGGYTQQDIVAAARALTGWAENSSATSPNYVNSLTPGFQFNAVSHDYGPNTPLTTSKNGGTWAAGLSYATGEVTLYSDGNRYAAKAVHVANNDTAPPNLTYWTPRTNIFFLGAQLTNYPNNSPAAVAQGEQVIDIVCAHPSTAKFIAKKLCNVFVSDHPSQAIQDAAANTFANTHGDIKAVMTTIVNHPDFYNPAYYRNKVKTPLEFVVSVARNFTGNPLYPAYDGGTFPNFGDLDNYSTSMGMGLFDFEFPTGYSEVGEDWLGTNPMLFGYRFSVDFAFNEAIGVMSTPTRGSVRAWMLYTDTNAPNSARLPNKLTYTTKDDIINYLVGLANNGEMTGYERNLYRTTLDKYRGGPFDISNTGTSTFTAVSSTGSMINVSRQSTETKLEALIYTILSSPGYMYQ